MIGGLTRLPALLLLGAAVAGPAPAAPADAEPSKPGSAASAAVPVITAAQRAQQKAADYARRQQAIQAHRAAVLDRVRREDAQHAPAKALPLPLPTVLGAPGAARVPDLPAGPASVAARGG